MIFTKKPEKHEKPIFFFKNGPIDPKIWKNEVPQWINNVYRLDFWNFVFFPFFFFFFAQNGGNFSKKWDFSPFLGKKHEIPKNWLKNKENAFQEKFLNFIYNIFLESVFLIFYSIFWNFCFLTKKGAKIPFLLKLLIFWEKMWKIKNFKNLICKHCLFIGELHFFRFWGQ